MRSAKLAERIGLVALAWLGNRDSNPNYLIQSQAFYR
jgi:hypothetical protein